MHPLDRFSLEGGRCARLLRCLQPPQRTVPAQTNRQHCAELLDRKHELAAFVGTSPKLFDLEAVEGSGWPLAARAQAMIPPTGMMDTQHPMPMKERYLKRFPQPAQVSDFIGLLVLDLNSSTLGYVRQIVRTPAGEIEFTRPSDSGGDELSVRAYWT